MTENELTEYYIPALEKCLNINLKNIKRVKYLGEQSDVLLHFDKLLGITEYEKYRSTTASLDEPLPEPLKELLIKLAGPHGKTILKAYRIKKGLEK